MSSVGDKDFLVHLLKTLPDAEDNKSGNKLLPAGIQGFLLILLRELMELVASGENLLRREALAVIYLVLPKSASVSR